MIEKSAICQGDGGSNPRLQQAAGTSRPIVAVRQSLVPLDTRLAAAYQISLFCKLVPRVAPRGFSWSPPDFGQARMAALGWTVSLAGREQPAGRRR